MRRDDIVGIVIILCVLTCVSGQDRTAFDCNRNGQSCVTGAACVTDGTCNCTGLTATPSEGFDCGIVITDKIATATDCTASCNNPNGQCVTVGGKPTCVCNEKFYGNDCSLKRVEVKCLGDNMYLNMNTFGQFAGIAFVKGKRDTPACVFSDVAGVRQNDSTVPGTWEGSALKLNLLSKTCGDLLVADATPKAPKAYQASFYIEYNQNFVTNKDELITAKCAFKDLNVIENTITGVTVTDNLYKGANVNGNYDPVVFSMKQGPDAKPISNNGLDIGTAISFSFNIPETSGFTTLLVKSIKATDGQPKNAKELLIVTNGCPTPMGSTVIATAFKMDATKRQFTGEISLFKFITSNNILFVSEVLICDSTKAPDCAIKCGTARKKRAANSAKELTITKFVTIRDGNNVTNNQAQPDQIMEDCLQRPEVLVTIVTVSTFLVVLLVICLILVCRMYMSPRKSQTTYSNDVGSSTLSIPRASVSYF